MHRRRRSLHWLHEVSMQMIMVVTMFVIIMMMVMPCARLRLVSASLWFKWRKLNRNRAT